MVKLENIPSYTDRKGYWGNATKIIHGNLKTKNFGEELDFTEVYSIKKLPFEKLSQ